MPSCSVAPNIGTWTRWGIEAKLLATHDAVRQRQGLQAQLAAAGQRLDAAEAELVQAERAAKVEDNISTDRNVRSQINQASEGAHGVRYEVLEQLDGCQQRLAAIGPRLEGIAAGRRSRLG